MLKRRRKIQKYIKALKNKKKAPSDNHVLNHKLENVQQSLPKGTTIPSYNLKEEIQPEDTNLLWQDPDDQPLHLPSKNALKKLHLHEDANEQQYEGKLKRFYEKKYAVANWAIEGDGQQEKDVYDYLNQQDVYNQARSTKQHYSVDFLIRSTEKHNSVITGMDWHGKILATCGYDQKLKLWSVDSKEENPQLRVKLEKDIYTQKYALSNCYFNNNSIYMGTLRQNYLVVDVNKWKINHVTSSFLADHKTYQNLRNSFDQTMIYSGKKISVLNHNCYMGGVIAKEDLIDAQFGKQPHQLFGISNDCFYEWDLRNFKIINLERKCLGFTKLSVSQEGVVAVGNKLGIVRMNTIENNKLKQYAEVSNLVTYVTELQASRDGSLIVALSKWKGNAARVIETHAGKCIQGWPTVNTKLGMATSASFSDRNELAIGSSNGFISLYSIKNN